jgi:hypothetical protein
LPDGVVVTRLTLDQKTLGSNPSPAAHYRTDASFLVAARQPE